MRPEMALVKVNSLTGTALNWAVARFVEDNIEIRFPFGKENPAIILVEGFTEEYSPSSNWGQGGLLIDRFEISLDQRGSNAERYLASSNNWNNYSSGSSYLEAAMRTLVRRYGGEVIEVPVELWSNQQDDTF